MFWTIQFESAILKDFWRRLVEVGECISESINVEEVLLSDFMTAMTDKKLREQLVKKTRNVAIDGNK